MKSNYKRLGDYIKAVNRKNTDLRVATLLGVSIQKIIIPSIANTVGTNMKTYKIIKKNQFAYGPVTSRNGEKISIALLQDHNEGIISQAYTVFEVKNHEELAPEYLMMWFRRPEFDRYARYHSHGSVREIFDWEAMCGVRLPVPSINTQREIVAEYKAVENRIRLNERLIHKLEETAQVIYRRWFVEGIELENLPEGWRVGKLEQFAKLRYGKMLNSELFLEAGYPVFSGYGVRGYYSEYMYEEPQILVLCRGVSGTGKVRLSPRYSFITNLSIVVEVEGSSVTMMYLYYYLRNSDLKSLDSGSAQSMITTGDLYFLDAVLPPPELQMKFDKVVIRIMKEIEIKNEENQKLTDLKELLLSRLATVIN